MPSEVLAKTCTVDTRLDNPIDGFQRKLDERRAEEIAKYIDSGLGTIPSSIVLSAQPQAELIYERSKRSITFKETPRSFLILDGQHRVFGFAKATTTLRVPVVIYNNLSRAQECRLFIDINTKQRPVPNELLLDIKRVAETESDDEALIGALFNRFADDPTSPLFGLMSPAAKAKGKLSRVTFNAAIKGVWSTVATSSSDEAYAVLSNYLRAVVARLKALDALDRITNPVVFRGLVLLFPEVAQRVLDRYGKEFTSQNFESVLQPLGKLKASVFKAAGNSHIAFAQRLQDLFRNQFTISGS